jgi:hypothetical protein
VALVLLLRNLHSKFLMLSMLCVAYALLTDTLADAGCNESNLPLAKALRQLGAAWPQVLADAVMNDCWCDAAVAWARAEGCAAPVLAVDADESDADDGDY